MTQEEKTLVLKDLSMRLPYGVILYIDIEGGFYIRRKLTCVDAGCNTVNEHYNISHVKPYLRPLASMTDDERTLFRKKGGVMGYNLVFDTWAVASLTHEALYWLFANMFDINGLIPMGLAVDVTNKKDLRNFNYDGYKKR